ncbi:AAA family ATPase [Rossellomorea vietnamensis]|uniref:AAA family ATPase n=1 Tax=Rossellomorea vietnamensis TaxID=218284 RepID=A0A5D4MAA8_9BACI|nr:ATPase domain-containing protein [Rossellomorea vietnamensis]TYR98859.1 AAA family ATPase [Rossellomorea vietnamensis]
MQNFISSGIEGLDTILHGGLPEGSSVLLDGAPGTGKTILGMQFLYEGATKYNENGIYITVEEFPDQIYKDMESFGWDLKRLEKEDKLRVICMSPETLIEQMRRPNGLFEQMVKEVNCKRVVIDSLNLFHYALEDPSDKRKVIYTLRNILRKFSLTTLLINEQTSLSKNEIPFVSYIVDGVIRLSLQSHQEIYRKRTLEILKMRGCKISEGEHIYRIRHSGIHLIPALSMIEDISITTDSQMLSTGVTQLDGLLGGGIPKGSTFILDTNSKANYKYLTASIIVNRILAGENCVILMSSLTNLTDLEHLYKLFNVDLKELVRQKRIYFIEHYNRPIPPGYESSVIKVDSMENDDFNDYIRNSLAPVIFESLKTGQEWFVYCDINTLKSQRGSEFLNGFFVEEVSHANNANVTILALCNFKELGQQTSSFLERTSTGVIQTWVDGNYQYLQLKKSPIGNMSYPLIVENIEKKPFIRLL